MKILHTESSLGWGGQEIRVLTEARGVAGCGHEVAIAAPPEARIYEAAADYGVDRIALPIGRKNLRGLAAMRHALARARYDVVNTHSSTDSWLVAVTCRLSGPRPAIVRTRHISAPVPRNAATRWLYRQAAHTVTTGEKLRLQVIAEAALDPSRVTSIPTGIDLERFRPGDRRDARARVNLPADASIVGIVATLRSWKGHAFLLEACAAIGNVLLVIVGDGPQRAALEKKAHELGMAGRVRFAGNQADVAPWMQAFDLFCLPSYANEGVPQALAQALACGLPVITTPVGSIEELVADGRTGVIVPPSDAQALRRAIEALLADAPRQRALGAAALVHARAHLGEAAMVEAMLRVFTAAAARR
jgi:glycosyltransferase involved in cell wall biosynthesis